MPLCFATPAESRLGACGQKDVDWTMPAYISSSLFADHRGRPTSSTNVAARGLEPDDEGINSVDLRVCYHDCGSTDPADGRQLSAGGRFSREISGSTCCPEPLVGTFTRETTCDDGADVWRGPAEPPGGTLAGQSESGSLEEELRPVLELLHGLLMTEPDHVRVGQARTPPPAAAEPPTARPPPPGGQWPEGTTTVMMRQVPRSYTQASLLKEVARRGFLGHIDFFHLPCDPRKGKNIGYCFVNLMSPWFALAFMEEFDGSTLDAAMKAEGAVLRVHPAAVQGYDDNFKKFHDGTTLPKDPRACPVFMPGGSLKQLPKRNKVAAAGPPTRQPAGRRGAPGGARQGDPAQGQPSQATSDPPAPCRPRGLHHAAAG